MIGTSGFSPLKWQRFGQLLDCHMKMVRGILQADKENHAHPMYMFVDLYAGPGLYLPKHETGFTGQHGSPLIAVRKLKKSKQESGMDFWTYFGDADEQTCNDLQVNFGRYGHDDQVERVYVGCCAKAVDRLMKLHTSRIKYGLVFVDPNGYPDWDALTDLTKSQQWRRVDLLINVNATVHKRCLKSTTNAETKRPTDHLRGLDKKYISLWTPPASNPHQFTLAYCTNWKTLEFKGQNFHGIDSAKGQAICRLIDYTEDERSKLDPIAGFLPGADWDRAILDRAPEPPIADPDQDESSDKGAA
jgi:three-Cys-motif partner protein